jgi:hypothetical protein
MERDYIHRQPAPFCWILLLFGVGCLIAGLASGGEVVTELICFPLSALFTLLAFAFKWLEISDKGNHLLVRFGPLTLVRKRVRYDAVRDLRRDRSLLIEGWGIHLGPRGWIWNIWGREVVELDLEKGRIRIGTDDPEGLISHLRERCDLTDS